MSHCYGYNSYSELLDAARKEREEKARQLEMANLKYRIRERENECFKLQKRVQELERQRQFLISNFADNGLCFMPLDFGCSERSENGCYCYAEKYMKEACARDRAEEASKE